MLSVFLNTITKKGDINVKKSYKLLIQALIFAALMMVMVVGCSSNSSNKTEEKVNNETAKTEDTAEGYPITIKHAFGETVIEKNQNVLRQSLGQTKTLH